MKIGVRGVKLGRGPQPLDCFVKPALRPQLLGLLNQLAKLNLYLRGPEAGIGLRARSLWGLARVKGQLFAGQG